MAQNSKAVTSKEDQQNFEDSLQENAELFQTKDNFDSIQEALTTNGKWDKILIFLFVLLFVVLVLLLFFFGQAIYQEWIQNMP